MVEKMNDNNFKRSIEELISNDKINEALAKAQFTSSPEVADLIVDACVSNGLIGYAFRAVKIRGAPLSLKEKDQRIKICLERNKNRDEIKKALIVAKQGVSQDTIDLLTKAYIDRMWLDRAIEAENLGCSRSARDELVKICIKNRKNSIKRPASFGKSESGFYQSLCREEI